MIRRHELNRGARRGWQILGEGEGRTGSGVEILGFGLGSRRGGSRTRSIASAFGRAVDAPTLEERRLWGPGVRSADAYRGVCAAGGHSMSAEIAAEGRALRLRLPRLASRRPLERARKSPSCAAIPQALSSSSLNSSIRPPTWPAIRNFESPDEEEHGIGQATGSPSHTHSRATVAGAIINVERRLCFGSLTAIGFGNTLAATSLAFSNDWRARRDSNSRPPNS